MIKISTILCQIVLGQWHTVTDPDTDCIQWSHNFSDRREPPLLTQPSHWHSLKNIEKKTYKRDQKLILIATPSKCHNKRSHTIEIETVYHRNNKEAVGKSRTPK